MLFTVPINYKAFVILSGLSSKGIIYGAGDTLRLQKSHILESTTIYKRRYLRWCPCHHLQEMPSTIFSTPAVLFTYFVIRIFWVKSEVT